MTLDQIAEAQRLAREDQINSWPPLPPRKRLALDPPRYRRSSAQRPTPLSMISFRSALQPVSPGHRRGGDWNAKEQSRLDPEIAPYPRRLGAGGQKGGIGLEAAAPGEITQRRRDRQQPDRKKQRHLGPKNMV